MVHENVRMINGPEREDRKLRRSCGFAEPGSAIRPIQAGDDATVASPAGGGKRVKEKTVKEKTVKVGDSECRVPPSC